MCGIAAFFAKNGRLENELGAQFKPMMDCLEGRGPDSAGFALYRDPAPAGTTKAVLQHPDPGYPWEEKLAPLGVERIERVANHCVALLRGEAETAAPRIASAVPEAVLMSLGSDIEIYKDTGRPCDVMGRFRLASARGSHAIGHTRMATESAVTTAGSHPFSTGSDLCLVHNGSLSNHNRLRRMLRRQGLVFRTENDSEVAAGFLTWRLREGDSLRAALGRALDELDGFFTFAVGTRDGLAVLRDRVACKPAVIAETPDYVAMASEYRSLAHLPGIETARLWEPEPGRIYLWSKAELSQRSAA